MRNVALCVLGLKVRLSLPRLHRFWLFFFPKLYGSALNCWSYISRFNFRFCPSAPQTNHFALNTLYFLVPHQVKYLRLRDSELPYKIQRRLLMMFVSIKFMSSTKKISQFCTWQSDWIFIMFHFIHSAWHCVQGSAGDNDFPPINQ